MVIFFFLSWWRKNEDEILHRSFEIDFVCASYGCTCAEGKRIFSKLTWDWNGKEQTCVDRIQRNRSWILLKKKETAFKMRVWRTLYDSMFPFVLFFCWLWYGKGWLVCCADNNTKMNKIRAKWSHRLVGCVRKDLLLSCAQPHFWNQFCNSKKQSNFTRAIIFETFELNFQWWNCVWICERHENIKSEWRELILCKNIIFYVHSNLCGGSLIFSRQYHPLLFFGHSQNL